MKGGVVVALMVAMAIMSVGQADFVWPDCPTLCEQICGAAVGRIPDKFCVATCQTILCSWWPPSPPPVPPPPVQPPVPPKECPARCEDLCGLTHDPACIGFCVFLFCSLRAEPPTTAALP